MRECVHAVILPTHSLATTALPSNRCVSGAVHLRLCAPRWSRSRPSPSSLVSPTPPDHAPASSARISPLPAAATAPAVICVCCMLRCASPPRDATADMASMLPSMATGAAVHDWVLFITIAQGCGCCGDDLQIKGGVNDSSWNGGGA